MTSVKESSILKKSRGVFAFILVVIFMSILAVAVPTLTSFDTPANNTYVKQNVTFNITLNKQSNVTFYASNVTSQWNLIGTNASNLTTLTFVFNTTSLLDGNYNITANATDDNGVTNLTVVNANITVDNILPTLSFVSPSPNNEYKGTNWAYLNVTVTETNLRNATFVFANSTYTNTTALTALTNGAAGVNFTALADGNYTFNVTVFDQVNQSASTATRWVLLDTVTPVVAYVSPTPDDLSYRTQTWAAVNITATETNFENASFIIANSTWSNTTNITTITNGAIIVNFTGLANSNYTFNVTALDKANRTASVATRWTIIDTVAPTGSYASPTPDDTSYRQQNWVYVNATVTETNFRNATFTIANSTWSNSTNITSVTNSAVGINFTGLADANYTFNITLSDLANQTSVLATRWTITDTTNPAVVYVAPTAADATYSNQTWIAINVTVTETNFRNATFTIANGTWSNITNVSTVTNGAVIVNFTTLANSNYTYNVTVSDLSNRTNTTATRWRTVGTTAPQISVTYPSNGAILGTKNFNITGTASSTNNVSSAVIVNNTNFGTNQGTYGSWNFTNTSIADGVYSLLFTANDSAGNTNTTTIRFTVDTTPATISSFTVNKTGTILVGSTLTSSDFNCVSSDATATTTVMTGITTATVGVKTATCTVTDAAGNVATKTVSYEVFSGTGGGSGSGGGASSATSPAKSIVVDKVESGKPATITVNDDASGIEAISLTLSSDASNVQLTVQKLQGKPADVPEAAPGNVDKYISISVSKVKDSDVKSARISFSVAKSWLSSNGFGRDNVALTRYANGVWNKLTTAFSSETDTEVTYIADTPGFSYYAITAEKKAAAQPATTPAEQPATSEPKQETTETTPPQTEEKPQPSGNAGLIVGVLMLALLVGLIAWQMRVKKK